jgi:Co/Zn/Cd efflux system component
MAKAITLNLNAASQHIKVAKILRALLEIPGVLDINGLHVWG